MDIAFFEYDIKREYTDFLRAKRLFQNGKTDVFIGGYMNEFPNRVYPQWHLDMESSMFLIAPLDKIGKNVVLTFNGDRLGWRDGFELDLFLRGTYSHYPIKDLKAGLRLIQEARLDGVIEYQHHLPETLPSGLAIQPIINGKKLWLVFQNNEKGRRLADLYDETLIRLMNSGKLQQIYGSRMARAGFPIYTGYRPNTN